MSPLQERKMHKKASPNKIQRELEARMSAGHGNAVSMDERHIGSEELETSESTRQLIPSKRVAGRWRKSLRDGHVNS